MKKVSIMNMGKDNKGIKTLRITVVDVDSIDIPVPVLKKIINNECDAGDFYNVEGDK